MQLTNRGAGCIGCLGLIVIIVVIAAISTAIGGSRDSVAVQDSTTGQHEVTLTDEERFLAQTRIANPSLLEASDASLIAGGRAICSDLDAGTVVGDVIMNAYLGAIGSGEMDDAEAQRLVGAVAAAAVYELCPTYVTELEAFQAQL